MTHIEVLWLDIAFEIRDAKLGEHCRITSHALVFNVDLAPPDQWCSEDPKSELLNLYMLARRGTTNLTWRRGSTSSPVYVSRERAVLQPAWCL
jgi:hypothetical protein